MTPKQAAIFDYIRAHQPVSCSAVATVFRMANATAGVHLQALSQEGRIRATALGRGSRWCVCDRPDAPRRLWEQASSIWEVAQRHAEAA